jgi:RNA polymerase sigma-54 factor
MKTRFRSRKEEDEYEKMSLKAKIMTTMTILNLIELRQKISMSSSDDTPDYKTQTNNYSDDDEERESPLAAPVSFHQDLINQLNTFILNDDERRYC